MASDLGPDAGLDSKGRGSLAGIIGSDSLSAPTNTLTIVASDSEGNKTVVTRKVKGAPNFLSGTGDF